MLTACISTMARPQVVARVGDHRGTQWIQLDVAVAMQQGVAVIDEAGFVTAFPEPSCSVIAVVDVGNVAPAQRLHHSRYGTWSQRGHEDVDVVGHQDIGMHGATFASRQFAQVGAIAQIVAFAVKPRLSIVATLDDMVRDSRQFQSSRARDGDWPCEDFPNARLPSSISHAANASRRGRKSPL